MKLIIAVIQDEDTTRLLSALMQEGFGVTKLATTGGFLRSGNTTLMIGVDEERVDACIRCIESVCRSRKQLTTANTSASGVMTGGFASYPVEVTVGGATLFILSVDQFLKV